MVEHPPLPVATLDSDQGVVSALLRVHSRADCEPQCVLATFEFRMTVITYLHGPFTMAQRRIRDIEDDHKNPWAAGSSAAWPYFRDRTVKLNGGW
jgi:hypothetical protein